MSVFIFFQDENETVGIKDKLFTSARGFYKKAVLWCTVGWQALLFKIQVIYSENPVASKAVNLTLTYAMQVLW